MFEDEIFRASSFGNGVHSIGKRPIPKLIDLLIESFGHLADLTSGQIFNAKTLCQLLHFPSGNALYKCLLNDLNERSLTALAFRDKERDITALTNLGHHEVHRSHAGIQTPRTVSAAVAASSVCALTFLCAQLLIHLSFHELCAEPFQHAQRLEAVEAKPLRWWEKFTGAIITALGSAIGGGMLALLTQNLVQR